MGADRDPVRILVCVEKSSACHGSERFYRLTNAFSRHFKNHALSVSLHYTHLLPYHKMLRVTPGAGVTDRLRSANDIAALVEAADPVPGKRGPYKKRAAQISNCVIVHGA
jgi:hypothetical protein